MKILYAKLRYLTIGIFILLSQEIIHSTIFFSILPVTCEVFWFLDVVSDYISLYPTIHRLFYHYTMLDYYASLKLDEYFDLHDKKRFLFE